MMRRRRRRRRKTRKKISLFFLQPILFNKAVELEKKTGERERERRSFLVFFSFLLTSCLSVLSAE
jgi:hypothetical protein